MKFLILSPTGVPSTGPDLFSAVFSTQAVRPNWGGRCVSVGGVDDTITIGTDHSPEELERELAKRGLQLLRRRGYTLYVAAE